MRCPLVLIVWLACADADRAVVDQGTRTPTLMTQTFVDPWSGVKNPPVSPNVPYLFPIGQMTVPFVEPAPRPLITGPHMSDVRAVTVIEDGRVAVSVDIGGSVRLWPSLDGQREPVVLAMNAPISLAIARDGVALMIAGIDRVGQLEMVRTTDAGEPLSRSTLDGSRPAVAIYATSHGILALRDDSSIALYDFAGVQRGELTGFAREHIRSLAVRRDRALAIAETAGNVHGRWIELDGGLSWGKKTPRLPIRSTHVALSPDHRRVAGTTARGAFAIVDLKRGDFLGHPIGEASDNTVDGDVADPAKAIDNTVLGFVDGDTVAVLEQDTLWEWTDRTSRDSQDSTRSRIQGGDVAAQHAVGDDVVVLSSWDESLTIVRRDSVKHLGYMISGQVTIEPGDDRFLLTNGEALVELDRNFRVRKWFDFGRLPARLERKITVQLFDTHRAIVEVEYTNSGGGYSRGVYLVDTKFGIATTIGNHYLLTFERNSGVILVPEQLPDDKPGTHYQTYNLLRCNRKTGRFGEPFRDTNTSMIPRYALSFDPERSNGYTAVIIGYFSAGGQGIEMLRVVGDGIEVVRTSEITPSDPTDAFFAEQLLEVLDRVGVRTPLGLRQSTEVSRRSVVLDQISDIMSDRLQDLSADNELSRLLEQPSTRRRPSPDGTLAVEVVVGERLVMRDAQDKERWATTAYGVRDVVWTADGELIASGGGVARVDLTNGALLDRQCAWGFGLWDEPLHHDGLELCEP
jgi:hypothetical protein